MSKTLKSLLSVLLLVGVLGGGYYFLVLLPSQEIPTTGNIEDINVKTQAIITNIGRINGYKMNDSILSDKRFTSLKNMRTELPSVDTGRSDPFAPTP